jgi:hypothetical protein
MHQLQPAAHFINPRSIISGPPVKSSPPLIFLTALHITKLTQAEGWAVDGGFPRYV